jgi:hypothetical protein
MRRIAPIRRLPYLTALGIIFLVCAVFGWGLQYKMSLYARTGGPSDSVPQAKLLSQKERPASSRSEAFVRPESTQPKSPIFFPAPLVATLCVGLRLAASQWMHAVSTSHASPRQRYSCTTFFSFRPPPPSVSFLAS